MTKIFELLELNIKNLRNLNLTNFEDIKKLLDECQSLDLEVESIMSEINTWDEKAQIAHEKMKILDEVSIVYKKIKNNYVWELLYSIFILKQIKLNQISVVCHSTGGVVFRKMLHRLEETKLSYLSSQMDLNNFLSKISYLAVPHFGAKGGSAFGRQIGFIYKGKENLGVKSVSMFLNVLIGLGFYPIDNVAKRLTSAVMDAQAATDLDPNEPFLQSINIPSNDTLADFSFVSSNIQNINAKFDLVVGEGSVLPQKLVDDLKPKLQQIIIYADHADALHEDLSQFIRWIILSGKPIPAIHHSTMTFNKIFS